ncbi:MAG: type IV toxin-antitoxin system AbiEi family antitoxin domain-containing protein [Albidovulum sp.]|nr:type IV toxin-antitoxin system AbiEi family antitoxin domain-containing protein [Albidovulum sp.]
MNTVEAIRILTELDGYDRSVFSIGELREIFQEKSPRTFEDGLRRLVDRGVLERAARGIYVFAWSQRPRVYLLEEIAVCKRHGKVSYVSLESALCEFGAISQIMVDRITVMTTGRSAEIATPWGVIEFTHTARPAPDIRENTLHMEGRPLRIARLEAALRDLRRVGRNLHMVDMDEYEDILDEQQQAERSGAEA